LIGIQQARWLHANGILIGVLIGGWLTDAIGRRMSLIMFEVFPTRIRARGMMVATFVPQVMGASVNWAFPVVEDRSRRSPNSGPASARRSLAA